MKEVLAAAEKKMQKSIDSLTHAFARIRTGRASPAMVEDIMVSYYGSDTQLKQVSSITVEDARTLAITPWEKNLIPDIEKAIHASGLGFNPVTTADVVRIPMPVPTEENRKEYVRQAKQEAEQARVSVRNARRDANQEAKEAAENEDEEHSTIEDIQKLTDKYIAEVDSALHEKESDLMKV